MNLLIGFVLYKQILIVKALPVILY